MKDNFYTNKSFIEEISNKKSTQSKNNEKSQRDASGSKDYVKLSKYSKISREYGNDLIDPLDSINKIRTSSLEYDRKNRNSLINF